MVLKLALEGPRQLAMQSNIERCVATLGGSFFEELRRGIELLMVARADSRSFNVSGSSPTSRSAERNETSARSGCFSGPS
ncbi:MAG: hypothetical protein HC923_07495 [Myxococcales bacterium]|nr:hypothetical protein [Myxococcales bacterium]